MRNASELVKKLEISARKRPGAFPRGSKVDYYKQFRSIEEYLNTKVHPQIAEMAMASQIAAIELKIAQGISVEKLRDEIVGNTYWLTDHGPEHIDTVINRASDLVTAFPNCNLSPYEIYVLLLAIHFHDVGNLYGRDKHEQKIAEVMTKIEISIIGDDSSEHRLIRDIASAHGGQVGGTKDTIGQLQYDPYLKDQDLRPHLLAAILRFADELADDYTRVSLIARENSLMFKASEIYHEYADRLRDVTISDGNIKLRFEIDKDVAFKKYGKGNSNIYLLTEIFSRTLKMHQEQIYCNRFMRPYMNINSIDVNVEFYQNRYMDKIHTIPYRLEEKGYPEHVSNDIARVCPELAGVTAQGVKKLLKKIQ